MYYTSSCDAVLGSAALPRERTSLVERKSSTLSPRNDLTTTPQHFCCVCGMHLPRMFLKSEPAYARSREVIVRKKTLFWCTLAHICNYASTHSLFVSVVSALFYEQPSPRKKIPEGINLKSSSCLLVLPQLRCCCHWRLLLLYRGLTIRSAPSSAPHSTTPKLCPALPTTTTPFEWASSTSHVASVACPTWS